MSQLQKANKVMLPQDVLVTPEERQTLTDSAQHLSKKDNPHSVTKSQVGLGSVENYGISTEVEAKGGTSNIKYMTPLRTKQAIDNAMTVVDAKYVPQVAPIEISESELDTTKEPLVICRIGDRYWYIETQFYIDKIGQQKNQLARAYNYVGDIMQRACYDGVWSSWSPSLQSLFQSVSSGKSLVASAITQKGVSTAADATFATMASNVTQIPSTFTTKNINISVPNTNQHNIRQDVTFDFPIKEALIMYQNITSPTYNSITAKAGQSMRYTSHMPQTAFDDTMGIQINGAMGGTVTPNIFGTQERTHIDGNTLRIRSSLYAQIAYPAQTISVQIFAVG